MEDVHAALTAARVTHGIDDAACAELGAALADGQFTASGVLVASGVAPVTRDGGLELAVVLGLLPYVERADGTADYLDRAMLVTVEAGQLVATYHAPVATPGVTVHGDTIAPGDTEDVAFRLGSGVQRTQEDLISAIRAGAVFNTAGLLDVVHHFKLRSDVDLRTGHLDMDGSVSIVGMVKTSQFVQATGDIDVKGVVEDAQLIAGGSIKVSRGLISGRVQAGHGVTMLYAQGAMVRAGGALKIERHSINSTIQGRTVVVGGRLVGGSAVAERTLVVQQAGSETGAPTMLTAGEAQVPLEHTRADLLAVKMRRKARRGRQHGAASAGPRAHKRGRSSRGVEAERLAKLERAREQRERQDELLRHARIDVTRVAHSGVSVHFGHMYYAVITAERGARYRLDLDSGKVVMERLR